MLNEEIANLLVALAKYFGYVEPKPQPKPPPVTSTERIGTADLHAILRSVAPDAQLYLSDRSFLLCKKQDIKDFLAYDKTNRIEYVAEAFDCDDFAYSLMGQISIPGWSDLAFGLVWTNLHALNICVTEERKVLFIEPQNDFIQSGLLPWQGDRIRFIIL